MSGIKFTAFSTLFVVLVMSIGAVYAVPLIHPSSEQNAAASSTGWPSYCLG